MLPLLLVVMPLIVYFNMDRLETASKQLIGGLSECSVCSC